MTKRRRHHVLGQARAKQRAQLIHQIGLRVLGNEVGNEALVPGDILARQHHHLTDSGVLAQGRLDLAQLDAEAADLDLVIDAPEILDVAVRVPTRQIASAVEPRALRRAEWV